MQEPPGAFPPVPESPRGLSSSPPRAAEGPERPSEARTPRGWRLQAGLFLATVLSVFSVGQIYTAREGMTPLEALLSAWAFAVPLLVILVCHEAGHYVAARLHGVPASLPYFLPLPVLNPFGTLGAIIVMPPKLRSARALLDVGAAGPLAGMVVAVPLMLIGLSKSPVIPPLEGSYIQEGQSLLYAALKRLAVGPIPPGHDIATHPIALGAWVGFLVTFLNLFPVGQLDGGHVAYALLGTRQDRLARWVRHLPLLLAVGLGLHFGLPVLRHVGAGTFQESQLFPVMSAVNWLVLWGLLLLLTRGARGVHPPVEDSTLDPLRRAVGVFTLLLFVALFMPAPWVVY